MILRTCLSSGLISLFALFEVAHSQPISRWGCGAGCAIEWAELSGRKDMGDGWRKVLIRSQVLLWLPGESGWRKAKPHEWRGEVSGQFGYLQTALRAYWAVGRAVTVQMLRLQVC